MHNIAHDTYVTYLLAVDLAMELTWLLYDQFWPAGLTCIVYTWCRLRRDLRVRLGEFDLWSSTDGNHTDYKVQAVWQHPRYREWQVR